MASRGVVGIFFLSALPLLCLELRRGIPDLGIKDFILLCGRIFLLLALLTLIISVTTSWLNSFKSSQVYLKEEEEEKNGRRQKLVRNKQQEEQSEKASRYIEKVLKPHQEMKLKKLEERFYQMSGETWKLSSGYKLGGDEELVPGNASQTSETSSREAARRRNLPEPVTKLSQPPERSTQKKVLFDWMMKTGYHTSLYSLSTSFPRRPLEVDRTCSLEDIGITVDTVLIVEEKEQSNSAL
ncbi:UBX domain-containing protein 8 isoform X4 [Tamandua tetradactyla]|uniref:UBX domain-containing protein 8 isoform X4 n=1 Tax=Tamandua tetradactyla TaxID=48850 RepID=UPI00405492F1